MLISPDTFQLLHWTRTAPLQPEWTLTASVARPVVRGKGMSLIETGFPLATLRRTATRSSHFRSSLPAASRICFSASVGPKGPARAKIAANANHPAMCRHALGWHYLEPGRCANVQTWQSPTYSAGSGSYSLAESTYCIKPHELRDIMNPPGDI